MVSDTSMGYCYSALFVKEWLVIPVCDIVIVCCLSRVVSDTGMWYCYSVLSAKSG